MKHLILFLLIFICTSYAQKPCDSIPICQILLKRWYEGADGQGQGSVDSAVLSRISKTYEFSHTRIESSPGWRKILEDLRQYRGLGINFEQNIVSRYETIKEDLIKKHYNIDADVTHHLFYYIPVEIYHGITDESFYVLGSIRGLPDYEIVAYLASNITEEILSTYKYKNEQSTSYAVPKNVFSIGRNLREFPAFYHLTSITIPSTVINIKNAAFSLCDSLVSIDVATDNANYSSQDGVLFNKNKTLLSIYPKRRPDTSYTIPNSVTSITTFAFHRCTGLSSVNITANVTSGAEFNDCKSLKRIEVTADNANYISVNGVLFNKDTTKLLRYPAGIQGPYTIPSSVKVIDVWAFSYTHGLTSMIIPNSVKHIRSHAFQGCTNLMSVTIPKSIRSIGYGVFRECTNLVSITVDKSRPINILGKNVFDGVDTDNACLYVPKGSVDAYRRAEEWKAFKCMKEIESNEIANFQNAGAWLALVTFSILILFVVWKKITYPYRNNAG